MYLTDEILDKLNSGREKKINLTSEATQQVTLPDIMVRSFAEVKELAGDALSWGEKNFLYQQAQKELKENKMAAARILSRANPQLANAVRLGIQQSSMLRSYDDLFPQRASSFVKPGSVASMFSPAGYLTELYREARNLHADTLQYHLDTRRPDLASLSLSQSNMDDELSTLSLSNELCLNNIQAKESKDYNGVMEMLAAYRQTGATPYNQPYEAVRQSIILQDPAFAAFRNNPAVAAKMDAASLLGIMADVSPDLREILTEEITEKNADELIKKNFGENTSVAAFRNIRYLARYYGLTYDEMASLLGLMTAGTEINPGVQLYKADQLVSLVNTEDGELSAVLIQRTPGKNAYQFGYAELVPTGVNNYLFNFTIVNNARSGSMKVGTGGVGSEDIFSSGNFDVSSGVPISLPVTLTDEQIKKTVNISVTRLGGGYYANVNYAISSFPFEVFLLKLNKLIRLYKTTGIAPSDIRTVIENSDNDLTITDDVLGQLFRVNYYMQRYGIDVYAALVLSGANIGQTTHGNQASAFTRLFNTPMLNATELSADGTTIKLAPAEVTDTFRTGVIKRAFGVNDTELYTLWTLVQGSSTPGDFACTVENLSALYRVSLLASIHGLSITELTALLSVSPYASTPAGSLSDEAQATLVGFTDRYTQWLKTVSWTVSDLYLMLTDRFSTTLSPDIENLITTLKNGLANQDVSATDEAGLIRAVAPFIAAAMQLDSAETAAAILQWLSQLKPQALTVPDFLTLADKDNRKDDETSTLVAYCQVMGQLALIARSTGLNASELSWVVAHPAIITEKATVLNHDISTLYDLTQLHAFLAGCGTRASEILTSLSGDGKSEENNLALRTVATALEVGEQALTQALAQCSSYTYFYSWTDLRDALQWLDVATTLGITPADVAKLIKLSGASPYADWVAASHALQAGLNTQQTVRLNATLDEALSSAVSGYVIKNIAPSWVIDRDKLYSWLLIDNQVSAQIKTTRIAEAIASVQLYVNRALSGQEAGVVSAVKSKTFFASDWDTYNKRYSTWAGVSQLAYYPENYVDPTLRIGQTGMMDEMLQSLSQSQLTSDTVEAAFKTYMTRFEEIANLDVISGYHDGISDQSGITYIIGRSAIREYYWRSADIDKMSDGSLPANAWSEWKKITAGIAPVTNLVRPVIFQSRLYVVWVESREVATTGSTTTKSVEYLLKYAHILHDGTWSAPVTITPAQNTLLDIADTGMYCAQDAELEKLYIYFYKKADSYSTLPASIAGLSILSDGAVENITVDEAVKTTGYIYLQMDTNSVVRLNTPYTGGNTRISLSNLRQIDHSWGKDDYTFMFGGTISDTEATVTDGKVSLKFNARARVAYNRNADSIIGSLVDLLKLTGNIGDIYYLPEIKRESTLALNSGRDFECLARKQSSTYDCFILVKDGIPPVTGDNIYVYNYSDDGVLNGNTPQTVTLSKLTKDSNKNKLWALKGSGIIPSNYLYALMHPTPFKVAPNELLFGDFKEINTGINSGDVKLTVSEGEGEGEIFAVNKRTKYTFEESLFLFKEKIASVPFSAFSGNKAKITLVFSASALLATGVHWAARLSA